MATATATPLTAAAVVPNQILLWRRRSSRVEIWRNEVATATGITPHSSSTDNESSVGSSKSRPTSPSSSGRRKSFIGFGKGRLYGEREREREKIEHVPPPLHKLRLLARVKVSLRALRPRSAEKTGMYEDFKDEEALFGKVDETKPN